MKRLRRAGNSSARGAGWAAETYQESNDDDGPGQQPKQRLKELHPHAIVSATPAGSHTSIVNAFTHTQATQPQPSQKAFHFVDTPQPTPFRVARDDDNFEMDIDSIFQEFNLMDPELSASWDEDHGLKAKRARTASVSESMSFFLNLLIDTFVG
jgi:hypothetical protein